MSIHPMQMLLVEDDEVDIECVERALDKLKRPITLQIAKNGLEALDLLYGKPGALEPLLPPELIVLDINMPKMNGIEFLKKLRSDPKFNSTNVLVLTTSNSFEDKCETLNLNIAGYIVKPLKADEFLSQCHLLLSG